MPSTPFCVFILQDATDILELLLDQDDTVVDVSTIAQLHLNSIFVLFSQTVIIWNCDFGIIAIFCVITTVTQTICLPMVFKMKTLDYCAQNEDRFCDNTICMTQF